MQNQSALRYLLPRPPFDLPDEVKREITELLAAAQREPGTTRLEYDRVPKWQFLCHLADCHEIVLHGTGNPAIEEFVPRTCDDANAFGAQKAVYAASDGIWPMFYAVLERSGKFSMHNGCMRLLDDENLPSEPYYFFSLSQHWLDRRPFRAGFVYLLPKETFVQDPMNELGGIRFTAAHWASLEAVRPFAIVPIEADDFPFLEQIRGHDDETLWQRMKEDPDKFPWVDEQYVGEIGRLEDGKMGRKDDRKKGRKDDRKIGSSEESLGALTSLTGSSLH